MWPRDDTRCDVDAEQARALGLVDIAVPSGGGEEAQRRAAGIAARSAFMVRPGKRAFHQQLEMPLAEAYAHAGRVMTRNMLARAAEEGIGAFLGRRPRRDAEHMAACDVTSRNARRRVMPSTRARVNSLE